MAERVGFEPYERGRYPIEAQLASLISENECRGKMPRASIQRLESGGIPLALLAHHSFDLEGHILEQERFGRRYVQRLRLRQQSSNQVVEHTLLGEKKNHAQESSLCIGIVLP